MNRTKTIALTLAAAVLTLTGCAKEIDEESVNATQIPWSNGIYRFCDGPTLIYFVDRDGEDEIEAIWPDMCYPEGGDWVYSTDPADYAPNGDPRVDGNVPDDGE